MKNKIVLISIILITSISSAQTKTDSIVSLSLDKITQIKQGESYVTFSFDIGNLEPLMFKANVSPNFKFENVTIQD